MNAIVERLRTAAADLAGAARRSGDAMVQHIDALGSRLQQTAQRYQGTEDAIEEGAREVVEQLLEDALAGGPSEDGSPGDD